MNNPHSTSLSSRFTPDSRLCPLSVAAIVLAVLALGLAILGVYNPWGALRFPTQQKLEGVWAAVGYGATFILPIFLGLTAALLGSHSIGVTERSGGKLYGEGLGVFSILFGGFATVIGLVCTFAGLVWPNL